MKIMKQTAAAALLLAFIFSLTSCNKQTCPTYSKAETSSSQEVKA